MDYLLVRSLHIGCVIISLSLFAIRGLLMLAGSGAYRNVFFRYAPHVVDTMLFTTALMLTTILHQYPFQQPWLTAKVLGLIAYIVLGSLALRPGQARPRRLVMLAAAMLTAAYIVSVARSHSPWGALSWL
ncbi:MAG: SirB2 family protein [Steroidobacteraceae bacterium]|nr:SirB2 family protein [Steroidobacteraceae bacterium]MCC7199656.1 SirB2 family protein [Gammaproteobacteria bacterium]